jgi:hypothetical protein
MHWPPSVDILTGATLMGALAHALDTFPPPTNKYWQWLLGCLQWFVGQRVKGSNNITEANSK